MPDLRTETIAHLLQDVEIRESIWSVLYGSFAYLDDPEEAGDVDVFVLLPWIWRQSRRAFNFRWKEIHVYAMSADCIESDIFQKKYGDMHACNFWWPILPIVDTSDLAKIVRSAREKKVKDTAAYLSAMGVRELGFERFMKALYYVNGIMKPYAWKIPLRIWKCRQFEQREKGGAIAEWLTEYRSIIISASYGHAGKHADNMSEIRDFFKDFSFNLSVINNGVSH